MLGGLLNRNAPTMEPQQQPKTLEEVQSVLAGGASKAASFKDSILRRGTVNSMTASPPKKETELADVAPSEETAAPSISSRLASLPGLGRLGANTPPERATVSGHVQAPRVSPIASLLLHALTVTADQLVLCLLAAFGPFQRRSCCQYSTVNHLRISCCRAIASTACNAGAHDELHVTFFASRTAQESAACAALP